jgi:hypothetical protein
MSRKHLGMKRPIRQFEKHYAFLLGLIEEIEIMNKKIDRQLGRIEKENE